VEESVLTVMSNSESAAFDAEMDCATNGDGLTIAFNEKYLMNTVGAIDAEMIVMKMNGPNSPVVVQGKDMDGLRLVLPVRVMG
jgi:DNA polymerase-3 subunit beta